MNGRTAAARVPGAERVDGVTYKVPLRNGQSITIPSPPRVYYTAAGVARVREELEMGTELVLAPAESAAVPSPVAATVITIDGVERYEKNGIAYLKLDAVARGLGFVQVKNETEYVRWETVNNYLEEFGFPNKLGKDAFIPENVFYRLAMKAKNEAAERFQAKIADEVIPSIRKYGAYMTPETLESVLTDPDFIIRLATRLKDEQAKNKALTAKIEADQPKVEFADHISGYKGTISVGSLAKLLSKNGITIGHNKLLQAATK